MCYVQDMFYVGGMTLSVRQFSNMQDHVCILRIFVGQPFKK